MHSRLLHGLFFLLCSYFVLWACAPIPNLIPPVPMLAPSPIEVGADGNLPLPGEGGQNSQEMGVGLALSEDLSNLGSLGYFGVDIGVNGDFWYMQHVSPHLQLGAIVFAGNTSFVGAGGMMRYWFHATDRQMIGFGIQGGWLWAGVELPISFRISKHLWLFTAPSVRASMTGVVNLPVGLSFQDDQTVLSLELNLGALGYTDIVLTTGVSASKRF